MEAVLERIRALFSSRLDYIRGLIDDGAQNEHWFRRRLHKLFDTLKSDGVIDAWRDECEIEGCTGALDFVLTVKGEGIALEVKAFLVGEQRTRTPNGKPHDWRADEYFVPSMIGNDIRKLSRWTNGRRFLVAIMYRNPAQAGWDAAVNKARVKFPTAIFEPIGDPAAYPPEFFIGVLQLK